MIIHLNKINFNFSKKPLLIGGKAMEYYGLRNAGIDIDLVISREDFLRLVKKYPHNLKDLYGDLGVIINEFEIWKTISYFDYDYLSKYALEKKSFLIIALEKLLFLKAIASKHQKYLDDMKMIVQKIINNQGKKSEKILKENEDIIKSLKTFNYIQKLP